jgi:hypothetical protein
MQQKQYPTEDLIKVLGRSSERTKRRGTMKADPNVINAPDPRRAITSRFKRPVEQIRPKQGARCRSAILRLSSPISNLRPVTRHAQALDSQSFGANGTVRYLPRTPLRIRNASGLIAGFSPS